MMTSLFEGADPAALLAAGEMAEVLPFTSAEAELLDFREIDLRSPAVPKRDVPVEPLPPRVERSDPDPGQIQGMLEAAREEAFAAGRRSMEGEMESQLQAERARVTRLAAQFAADRQGYFGSAEKQVVRLVLAIARRVLSCEVRADEPLLLATVRAALSRVQGEAQTEMRVPEGEAELWRRSLAGEDTREVCIIEDPRLAENDCVLETRIGQIDLRVSAQMDEITRSFDELLGRGEGRGESAQALECAR